MIQTIQQYVNSKLKEGFAEYVTRADIEQIVCTYSEMVIDECSIQAAQYSSEEIVGKSIAKLIKEKVKKQL
jgi:hypothetical protein